MSKIGFLTDSCSDIPQELADKYGIEVVGFPINLDGVEYMERKDFTNDQFYQMMRDAQGVPTTAAITQLQFCDIYARYADEGYTDLVYLSINAGGSSTYNNAVKAMELLEEERPGYTMKIQVIDSHTYSMPYGWYFCECARKVRNGGELAACVAELKQKLDCVEICLAAAQQKPAASSGGSSAAKAPVKGGRASVTTKDAAAYASSSGKRVGSWSTMAKNAGVGWNQKLYVTNIANGKVAIGTTSKIGNTIAWVDKKNVKGYRSGSPFKIGRAHV